jgi:hypothetical protein
LWEPRWYSDEGTFTTVAWLHSTGVPLYAGVFDNSPPGIYWLYGLLLRLGAAQHHVVVQAALLLAVLVSVLCVYALASRWFGASVAFPAALLCAAGLSLPTLDGDLLNVEIAALPFFLIAFALAGRRGVAPAIAAGALVGIALLIRPSYVLDSLVILLALVLPNTSVSRARLTAAGAGLLLTLAGAALVLQLGGSLHAYLTAVSPDERAYLLWANGGSLMPLVLRLAIGFIIAALWFWSVRRRSWRLLAIWLPASAVGASLTPRELSHYAIEVIPPLAIGIAALAAFWVRRTPARRWWTRLAAAALAVLPAFALLVGGAEFILIAPNREVAVLQHQQAALPFLHNFSYPALPQYYARWANWVVRHPFQEQSLGGFPGPIRSEVAEAAVLDRLADLPSADISLPRAGEGIKVLILGDRSWVYFIARLPAATPYIALNSAFRLLPHGPDDIARAIDLHHPDLIAVADAPPGDWLSRLQQDGYGVIVDDPWPTFALAQP